MKKIVALFMSFAVVFVMSACSSDNKNVNKTDKTAAELLQAVINSVEFPPTVDITEESAFEEMGIDLSLTEDHAAVRQMLSVDVIEVIILKAKDGEAENITEQLKKRKESLINDFAFYPEQVESANATAVGASGNVAYLICHADAKTAEEKLIEEINK